MGQYYEKRARYAEKDDVCCKGEVALFARFREERFRWEILHADWPCDTTDNWADVLHSMKTRTMEYSDKTIDVVVQAALDSLLAADRRKTLYIDSQAACNQTVRHKRDPVATVVAPVHRDNHWVFYGLRRHDHDGTNGPVEVFFADSQKGGHRDPELARLQALVQEFDPTFPPILDIRVRRTSCPRQHDNVSCGVYVAESVCRFLTDPDDVVPWLNPREMREKHTNMATKYLRMRSLLTDDDL